MDMFINLIEPNLQEGLILSIMFLGIMIAFKILNFPDFTAEGSYPLGGIICAVLISAGVHPGIATIVACMCAGIAGILTAFLHLRFRINTLLAGIIVSYMIYGVNLKLMGEKTNITLLGFENLFSIVSDNMTATILSLLGLNAIIIIPILFFFRTDIGLRLRAGGRDPKFAARNGIDVAKYTILGLFIGNSLCGLSGSIMAQIKGGADITMGFDVVVQALAALMIGELILNPNNIAKQIIAPFIGIVVYSQIQSLAIAIGFDVADLKFLTGGLVLLLLMMRRSINRHPWA